MTGTGESRIQTKTKANKRKKNVLILAQESLVHLKIRCMSYIKYVYSVSIQYIYLLINFL